MELFVVFLEDVPVKAFTSSEAANRYVFRKKRDRRSEFKLRLFKEVGS